MFFLRMLAEALRGALERLVYRAVTFLLAFIIVSVILAIVLSLLGRAAVRMAEGGLDERWSETLAPLTTLPEEVEAVPQANRTALDLEAAAADLGLDLSPASRVQSPAPDPASAAQLHEIEAALGRLARQLVTSGISELPQPSESRELTRFLDSRQAALAQVVKLAFQGSQPHWECDLHRGQQAPVPNFAAVLHLQQLLIADAVQRFNDGDARSAAVVLEASRRLNQSFLKRPELASQLTSLAVLRLQLALARRLSPPPLEWIPFLEQLDLEPLLLHTLQVEAFKTLHSSRRVELFDLGPRWTRHVMHPLVRPFERWAMLDHSEAVRQAVAQLPELDPATLERGELAAELHGLIPRWNHRAHAALPDAGGSWLQAVRASLGVELTREVLGVRKTIGLAEERYRRVLPELEGVRPSMVEGYAWRIRAATDELSIALEGPRFELPDRDIAALPLQVTLRFEPILSQLRARREESTDAY